MDIREEQLARDGHRKLLGKRLAMNEITLVDAVKEDYALLFGYKKLKSDLEQFRLDTAR